MGGTKSVMAVEEAALIRGSEEGEEQIGVDWSWRSVPLTKRKWVMNGFKLYLFMIYIFACLLLKFIMDDMRNKG